MSLDWLTGKQRKLVRRKCRHGLWCNITKGDPVICRECLRIHGIQQPSIKESMKKPMRGIYKHGIVFAPLQEIIGFDKSARRKLGEFLNYEPAQPDDPTSPYYVLYTYTGGGKRQQRYKARQQWRKLLRKKKAPKTQLFRRARRFSQKRFLTTVTQKDVRFLQSLGITPREFWKYVKHSVFPAQLLMSQQMTLAIF